MEVADWLISEGNSPERVTMMRALGAEVVTAPQVDGCFGPVIPEAIIAGAAKLSAY